MKGGRWKKLLYLHKILNKNHLLNEFLIKNKKRKPSELKLIYRFIIFINVVHHLFLPAY